MQDDPLKPARDEVFRKLGRNIALFQQVEGLLKRLVAGSLVEGGSQQELERFIEQRNAWTATSTFGVMFRHFVDEVLGKKERPDNLETERTFMRSSFQVQGIEYMKQREGVLAALVEERNQLVHHLLQNFDLWDSESIQKLDAMLDPQAERIRAKFQELKQLVLERQEMVSDIARHIAEMPSGELEGWLGASSQHANKSGGLAPTIGIAEQLLVVGLA